MDEHWIEVTEASEIMCNTCKSFKPREIPMNNNTESRSYCLNCASNWTRMGMYETDNIHVDEHAQDAKVAARLLNVYNNCISWRELQAETDLKRFLVTASLAMLSWFQTSSGVLKQVSHRGANLENCLAGLEESFWLFSNSCRHGEMEIQSTGRGTDREKPTFPRSRTSWYPRCWDKLAFLTSWKSKESPGCRRFPPPTMMTNPRRWRSPQMKKRRKAKTMIPRHLRCEDLGRTKLLERLGPGRATLKSTMKKKMREDNLQRRRSVEQKSEAFVNSSTRWSEKHLRSSSAFNVEENITWNNVRNKAMTWWRVLWIEWEQSWRSSPNPPLLQTNQRWQQRGEGKTNFRRKGLCLKENDGIEQDSIKKKSQRASTASPHTCLRSETEKKADRCWWMASMSIKKAKACEIELNLILLSNELLKNLHRCSPQFVSWIPSAPAMMKNSTGWSNKKGNNMVPIGTFDTSSPIPMAWTLEPLRWHASAVRSTLASDGATSTNGPRMPTGEGDTKHLHGWSSCRRGSMQHCATPLVVFRTKRATSRFHAMKLDGSMSSKSWSTTTSGRMDNNWQAPLSRTTISSPNDGTISNRSSSQSSSKQEGWEPKC